ncbi:CbtA family protein [Thalassobaculum sp.]|uniref:CbtA family protein n=1 Tax=Thalassobaculum sp. TaxID=2022740 RepID=UPI0032EB0831
MIRRLFLSALVAGLLAGLTVSALQAVTTVPLILQAESFEAAGEAAAPQAHTAGATAAHDHGSHSHGSHSHGADAWAPADGIERTVYTTIVNIVGATGFALLLTAGFVLRGEQGGGRRGLLWGLAGFAAMTLSPALGLPPEVPGSVAADLASRQLWWISAVVTAAAGLWLLAFGRSTLLKVAGVALLALPHVVGAPHPHGGEAGLAPPELAARFAATSIVVSAVTWALIGWLSGTFYQRFGQPRGTTA